MTTEDLIKNYYQTKNQECPNIYCKDCGKLLIYDGAKIRFKTRGINKGDIYGEGFTFLSEKVVNNHIYHLSRCKECVAKKYPHIKDVKFLYAQKAAYYTQYAYDIPDDDFNIFTKQRQSVTKDKMIQKYGDEEGLLKWNSYCNKQSITNTFEYKREKYGMTKEEFNDFNKSRSCTKELFIQRYGELEGNEKWNEYCQRQSYTNSLQYFIEKYGQEKGSLKYQNFAIKRNHAFLNITSVSKISIELFNQIQQYFQNDIIYYDNNEYELILEQAIYHLDYYDKTLNVLIEFNGDYWHYNPKFYAANKDVILKWEYDKKRISDIQAALNCKIIIVWENTYRTNKQKTIDTIIDIIKNKNINYIEI